ncbi:hypothetical protein B0H10DRAFT_2216451 [Mycena sp. CBHHK59/15]|nr:hypothetical protein B0H10DRAFT_2216451 [Mycena sp. CBHHK59/15]
MGRALFSATYGSQAPAIRVEPEPIVCPYDKWSVYNQFDPDSDDFFKDAQLEAFIDKQEDEEETDMEPSFGRDSPVDPPSTIPIRLTALWDHLLDETAAAVSLPPSPEPVHPSRHGRDACVRGDQHARGASTIGDDLITSPIHPPSALRNSTTATDLALGAPAPWRTEVLRIAAPTDSSAPIPVPASPSTPPPHPHQFELLTPSPAPPVTPHIYTWGSGRLHAPAIPTSPLPNSGARQSLVRIPARRRVQNI